MFLEKTVNFISQDRWSCNNNNNNNNRFSHRTDALRIFNQILLMFKGVENFASHHQNVKQPVIEARSNIGFHNYMHQLN